MIAKFAPKIILIVFNPMLRHIYLPFLQKSGEFEADTRDVITTHQHVIESKLYGLSSVRDPEILQIIEDYDKFLADCNAVDYADIINSVSRCFQSSDNNTKQFYQDQQYTILGIPTTLFEVRKFIFFREKVLFLPTPSTIDQRMRGSFKEGKNLNKDSMASSWFAINIHYYSFHFNI